MLCLIELIRRRLPNKERLECGHEAFIFRGKRLALPPHDKADGLYRRGRKSQHEIGDLPLVGSPSKPDLPIDGDQLDVILAFDTCDSKYEVRACASMPLAECITSQNVLHVRKHAARVGKMPPLAPNSCLAVPMSRS